MADPIQLLNTRVEIQSALATAKTITAITKASEAVITATHDYSIGDIVVVDAVAGMAEINRRAFRVKSVSTTVSFVAESLDSTDWGTYVSGGTVQKVSTFLSFDSLTNFDFPEPQPNPQSVTTIHANEEQEVFGLDSAPGATCNTHSFPIGNAALTEVRKASLAKTDRVLRITFQNGNVMIVNTKLAGGRGISGDAGAVAGGQISLRFRATEQVYAS